MQPEPDTRIIPPRDSGELGPGELRSRDPGADPPTRARTDAEPVILQRWVGRYELIHRLAHGGMATVYLGRSKGKAGFEKIVAVKVIHPHLAGEAEFVGMFLDEARIAARIHHPHVVEILDLGERDGVYYMVMEFIEGENLAALVRALGGERLPVLVVLQILADTLEGLGAAHELRDGEGLPYRLVHRDVSPHNILINLDGWAKVADFGIMKAAGKASNTRTGELRGKLAYMSPEQARGDAEVDHRTDLFALGVIAWELLTGTRLFACKTEAATLEKVMACEVPPFADARPELADHPDLREGLEALLVRALAPRADDRFASAAQMLAEVKRLTRLADDLPEAHDEARVYLGEQMRRFFLRRVNYARAALRLTGEHDVVGAPLIEPTMQVGRPPTGSQPGTAGTDLAVVERPGTGSHSGIGHSNPGHANPGAIAASASHPQLSNPLVQWSMWLLLPMLGAGIAVAAMLLLGPRFGPDGRGTNDDGDSNTGSQRPTEPAVKPGESGESPVRPSTTEISPREYQAIPQKPAGTIRWWFSTSPKGASLFIDGEPHGTTPTFVHVPTNEEPVEIRLELDGYAPHILVLPPANDQSFTPQLEPLPAKADDPKASKRPRKKTGGDAKSTQGSDPGDPGSGTPKKTFVPPPDSLRDAPASGG